MFNLHVIHKFKSSRSEVPYKKGVLKILENFQGKPRGKVLLNKIAEWRTYSFASLQVCF